MCRLRPMETVITVSGLTKSFGRTRALDGLDLVVRAGEVHGFLGPNGAGKSTTIRVLLGLLRADAGSAELLGGDPWRDAVALHRRLAYVPGDVVLWPTLTGGEIIDLLGRLRGGLDRKRRAELLERFDLDPTKKGRDYSKGNRQKVALVAALAADVELLLLDEPTAGLDPLMEAVFRETGEEARRAGRSVLLSSHILAEVEALCDRVSIIRNGRTVESGTLVDLRHLTRTSVTAETTRPVPDLSDLAGVHAVRRPWRSCSCATTATGSRWRSPRWRSPRWTGPRWARRPTDERADRDRSSAAAGAAPGPGADPAVGAVGLLLRRGHRLQLRPALPDGRRAGQVRVGYRHQRCLQGAVRTRLRRLDRGIHGVALRRRRRPVHRADEPAAGGAPHPR